MLDEEAETLAVRIPQVEEQGISTQFNRAVVSSQAFQKQFPELKTASRVGARAWLANGMEQAVSQFLDRAAGKDIEGAIYHPTDENLDRIAPNKSASRKRAPWKGRPLNSL